MSENEDFETFSEENSGDDDAIETASLPAPDTLRVLEAVLFASDELITTTRLKAILPGNPDAREIGKMVERINRALQKERHPFEIVDIGGGYQFKTIAYYHPWVRQIFQDKAAKRLSIQALECLSIIAYRQPLSKAEIEAIRGVLSDGAMKTLLEKRLITVVGRSEKAGKPLLYGTTQDFLKYFGLNKIADLPRIEEFEAMVRQKMENLPIDELKQATAIASEPQAGVEGTNVEEASIEIHDTVPHTEGGEEASIEIGEQLSPGPEVHELMAEMEPLAEAERADTKQYHERTNGNDDDGPVFEKKQ